MPTANRYRSCCLLICYPKTIKIKRQNYNVDAGFDGRETRSLILREEHRLWLIESRVLRKKLGGIKMVLVETAP
jgi:hypothetical protein